MNQQNIFSAKNIKTITLIVVVMVVFGLVISLIQTPKYKSSAKLLVIFSQDDVNPYTSVQTSNYIAGILKEVIYSDSFINSVFKSSFDLKDDIGFNQEERMKNWKKMVKPRLQENKGIITIDVYHKDNEQANNFAQAISYTISTNHSLYHGSGNSVAVKTIGTPSVSQDWDQPNIPQNILLSLMAGIFIGLTFIIIFPEQELINFVLGRKIIKRDETINFENVTSEAKTQTEENDNQEKGYYNW